MEVKEIKMVELGSDEYYRLLAEMPPEKRREVEHAIIANMGTTCMKAFAECEEYLPFVEQIENVLKLADQLVTRSDFNEWSEDEQRDIRGFRAIFEAAGQLNALLNRIDITYGRIRYDMPDATQEQLAERRQEELREQHEEQAKQRAQQAAFIGPHMGTA